MSKLTVVSYSFIALALSALVYGQSTVPNSAAVPAVGSIQQVGIMCSLDGKTGLPKQITTRAQAAAVQWLTGPLQFHVRNEATNVTSAFTGRVAERGQTPSGAVTVEGASAALSLNLTQQWQATKSRLTWDLAFTGNGPRAGHEIVIELPILSPGLDVFTPSERGLISVARRPTYEAIPYGHPGVSDNRAYVLPLVSVFDARRDAALTIALPADVNTPDFSISWKNGKTLRLRLSHRGMGTATPSKLRVLFYAHPADYRSVLGSYINDFPAYFKPVMPRGPYEASFYYHHIHDHPDFDEMARQNVRYIWSSFWFTHVGEYLPAEKEWYPYTYANWWKLGEKMSDVKINDFVQTMQDHGVAVFAFFNVDEYGGPGTYHGINQDGNSPVIEQDRNSRFADAVVKDVNGKDIVSWKGDKVMNPDCRAAFYPYLMDQVKQHLARLPGIYGFVIDRMDWAATIDYGHDDGLTMVGDRAAENMTEPMGAAVREVCRLTHAQGKRVFINQFYRVELLRDVDGVAHENDYLPALGYLTPLRPAAAWNFRKPYHGDLLQFEAQLKRRLQFALFPHMIAHEFKISQQDPDPRAADLLEIYAPLFATLIGKDQVLLPHCVAVTGANDVNLFRNGDGNYVAPVTSRARFLSRRVGSSEAVIVTLRVPDGGSLQWAHVYSADGAPYRGTITALNGVVKISLQQHQTASMVVVGKGSEPPLGSADAERLAQVRDRLFGQPAPQTAAKAGRPRLSGAQQIILKIEGVQLGQPGGIGVMVNGRRLGEFTSDSAVFPLGALRPTTAPTITLTLPDEGVWFAPVHVALLAQSPDGKSERLAEWRSCDPAYPGEFPGDLKLPLAWRK